MKADLVIWLLFCHNWTKIVFAKELTWNEDKLTIKHDRFKCEKIFWMNKVIGVYSLIFEVYSEIWSICIKLYEKNIYVIVRGWKFHGI